MYLAFTRIDIYIYNSAHTSPEDSEKINIYGKVRIKIHTSVNTYVRKTKKE